MKKLLIVILAILFFAGTACAATNVTLKWDPNSEADLAGYNLYRSDESGKYTTPVGVIPCGPNDSSCCEFMDPAVPDGTWYWVATAYDTEGNESGYSNEVSSVLDSVSPIPPEGLTIWQKIIAFMKWILWEMKQVLT